MQQFSGDGTMKKLWPCSLDLRWGQSLMRTVGCDVLIFRYVEVLTDAWCFVCRPNRETKRLLRVDEQVLCGGPTCHSPMALYKHDDYS